MSHESWLDCSSDYTNNKKTVKKVRNNQGFLWLENSWVGEKKIFDNSLSLFRHFQRHIGHRYYILASENYNKKQCVAGCFYENRLITNPENSSVLNLWSFTAVFPWVWILQIEKFEDFESWISIFFFRPFKFSLSLHIIIIFSKLNG